MKRLRPIMFAGTGSDVGKSVIATAFCRIFKQDGYSPAPFKAQNMALNSYATPDGLEIGRAQAVQAEAAGVAPHTDMNPLLLKPQTDKTCQVVLNGKPIGNRDAYDYFKKDGREAFRIAVCDAFNRLNQRYNPIVMEGAGSISEINLRETDIVNMPMAMRAGADVILVADIDRGGVFASIYGSVLLQTPEERKRIKGIIINKFRGDIRLFENGVKMIEDLCGVPVVGVIPYYKDIHIEEEDNLQLNSKTLGAMSESGKVHIAVVLLRHLSNFTDFDMLEHDPRVHLFYTNNVKDMQYADVIIIPGTKCTLADLYELRRNGMAEAIVKAARNGKTVLGICGGYQMLGTKISDPDGIEGDIFSLPGLSLLPLETVITNDKVTRQVRFRLYEDTDADGLMEGYEIHSGRTVINDADGTSPLCVMSDNYYDGCVTDKCMGTYIHGILDNAKFVDYLIAPYIDRCSDNEKMDYREFKEQQYNLLADHVRRNVNMPLIYRLMEDSADD
ncbi:MAG: cobyric acid synthase [Prevotella sp.]